jgi:hypothetical protein
MEISRSARSLPRAAAMRSARRLVRLAAHKPERNKADSDQSPSSGLGDRARARPFGCGAGGTPPLALETRLTVPVYVTVTISADAAPDRPRIPAAIVITRNLVFIVLLSNGLAADRGVRCSADASVDFREWTQVTIRSRSTEPERAYLSRRNGGWSSPNWVRRAKICRAPDRSMPRAASLFACASASDDRNASVAAGTR